MPNAWDISVNSSKATTQPLSHKCPKRACAWSAVLSHGFTQPPTDSQAMPTAAARHVGIHPSRIVLNENGGLPSDSILSNCFSRAWALKKIPEWSHKLHPAGHGRAWA